MVKSIRRYLITALMILTFATIGLADAPPDPGGDPGTGGGTPVGGSPIGSGFIITMTLAMVYGSRKVITMNKEK